ncbi:hypothetical protein HK098_000893 [Nowakowskiella sp. JEL0407]|nr:hypothetical protein HK098_000893 [Nowakowskiella sp. JEL0407]
MDINRLNEARELIQKELQFLSASNHQINRIRVSPTNSTRQRIEQSNNSTPSAPTQRVLYERVRSVLNSKQLNTLNEGTSLDKPSTKTNFEELESELKWTSDEVRTVKPATTTEKLKDSFANLSKSGSVRPSSTVASQTINDVQNDRSLPLRNKRSSNAINPKLAATPSPVRKRVTASSAVRSPETVKAIQNNSISTTIDDSEIIKNKNASMDKENIEKIISMNVLRVNDDVKEFVKLQKQQEIEQKFAESLNKKKPIIKDQTPVVPRSSTISPTPSMRSNMNILTLPSKISKSFVVPASQPSLHFTKSGLKMSNRQVDTTTTLQLLESDKRLVSVLSKLKKDKEMKEREKKEKENRRRNELVARKEKRALEAKLIEESQLLNKPPKPAHKKQLNRKPHTPITPLPKAVSTPELKRIYENILEIGSSPSPDRHLNHQPISTAFTHETSENGDFEGVDLNEDSVVLGKFGDDSIDTEIELVEDDESVLIEESVIKESQFETPVRRENHPVLNGFEDEELMVIISNSKKIGDDRFRMKDCDVKCGLDYRNESLNMPMKPSDEKIENDTAPPVQQIYRIKEKNKPREADITPPSTVVESKRKTFTHTHTTVQHKQQPSIPVKINKPILAHPKLSEKFPVVSDLSVIAEVSGESHQVSEEEDRQQNPEGYYPILISKRVREVGKKTDERVLRVDNRTGVVELKSNSPAEAEAIQINQKKCDNKTERILERTKRKLDMDRDTMKKLMYNKQRWEKRLYEFFGDDTLGEGPWVALNGIASDLAEEAFDSVAKEVEVFVEDYLDTLLNAELLKTESGSEKLENIFVH